MQKHIESGSEITQHQYEKLHLQEKINKNVKQSNRFQDIRKDKSNLSQVNLDNLLKFS